MSQGWPAGYGGVMLQGFYWDSFDDSQWTVLEKKANDFSGYFDLVWVPQSGKAAATKSMGYDPLYYFNQNSSFGTEAELKSMIRTFKEKHIGTIADVVINHHGTNNGWFGFPAEVYKGVTYQNLSTDVCADDDGGSAATEARKTGTQLSQNNDDGEGWGGMRDLDHKSANVQKIVKAYENYLLNDLGYAGFRYDMVKGFAASHVGNYNTAAKVKYSVGEYWDGNANTVKAW
ncbi:MAG: alpha-amylase, partial [Prevotella sp.]|nr:alpha-amylase [Prevotella sp.]